VIDRANCIASLYQIGMKDMTVIGQSACSAVGELVSLDASVLLEAHVKDTQILQFLLELERNDYRVISATVRQRSMEVLPQCLDAAYGYDYILCDSCND